jgi:gluconolactonase
MFPAPVDPGLARPDRAVSTVVSGVDTAELGSWQGARWYEGGGRVGEKAVERIVVYPPTAGVQTQGDPFEPVRIGFLIDMDGVLYRGEAPIAGMQEFLATLDARALPHVFLTNNSSMTPRQYADKLRRMGVVTPPERILNSAIVTATYVARSANARVLMLGGTGLREALAAAGLEITDSHEDATHVVVGLDREVSYEKLARATLAVRRGAAFLGTNGDLSYPSERGLEPGAGALLAAVEAASDVRPKLFGKPEAAMFETALLLAGTEAARAALVCFFEGPAVDEEGNVFFSDITSNRILKMNSRGDVSVFRADSGRANGNAFDAAGRLISCEGFGLGAGGRRRVVRTDMKSGATTVLTEHFEGKRYNSPNDVCVDGRRRIWFTDPRYGDRDGMEMDVEGVYRIDPEGGVTRVLGKTDVQKPNGIAVTPDGNTMYVVDSNDALGGNRKIWAFDVSALGELGNRRMLCDFRQGRGADGLRVDMLGNLWIAAGIRTPRPPAEVTDVPQGVYVFNPQGKLLGRVPIPEDYVTNLAFGSSDRKTLYVTAGTSIYKVPVTVPGYAVYPPIKP